MSRVRATLTRMGRDVAHEVVVNVLAALALGAIAFVALGGRVEDLYLRVRGAAPVSGEVTVVGIDAEALYLWNPADPEPETTPHELLAELVRFLSAAHAHVIVLDVLTDRPAPGDDLLGLAVAAHPRVVLAERFVPGPGGLPFAAGSVLRDQGLSAYANLGLEEQTLFSGEMLVRAVPLLSHVARARLEAPFPAGLVGGWQDAGGPMPALALAAAWLQRSDAPRDALGAALSQGCDGGPCRLTLADLGIPASGVPLEVPVDLNFRGPEGGDGIPFVSAARVLRSVGESALARTLGVDLPISVPEDLVPLLEGKVVVVGRVDPAAADRFVTPFSFPTLQTADMSGARVHAQLIEQLLTGHHTRRPGGRVGAWVGALLVGAACLGSRRRLGDVHLATWLGAGVLLLGGGAWVFARTDGLILDVGPALAALSLGLIAVHLYDRNSEDG